MQLNQDISVTLPNAMREGVYRIDSATLLSGFLPAFRHLETGEIRLCRYEDGRLSHQHLLDSLPEHWILERDGTGRPVSLVSSVEPGFLRVLQFWSLEDLSHPALDG